ncbi:hypothetical protein HG264_15925 [Pseudomonas sp. gcc21]|uniref:hypothetical protein n=1 Tax=Pseudomonas sp. gcc21 TaxID=2726989 RepID=UPI001451F08F|nr:hypothetical protein [Pseudomonas sp. gcc21]QJD60261.1 hypothetical protein HG264_15925 [Pseudomonas sp. gcc21]
MSFDTREGSSPPSVWHVLNVGDPLLADQQLESVLQAVDEACRQAVDDLAVFQRFESEGRLHCELKLYFSPGLDALARSLGARPCGVPVGLGLEYFAGSEQLAQRLLSQE